MNTYDYEKIIEEGKALMRDSEDAIHDAPHAERVEQTAFEVYKELKEKEYPGIDTVTPELISIVSWWHDCYKSILPEFTITSNFNEGKESAKIIRKKLTGRMRPEDLETVIDAVENHAGAQLAPYFFLNKTKSPLHKILLEADAHDLLSLTRVEEGSLHFSSMLRVMWIVVDLLEVLVLPFYLRAETTRKDLGRKIWDFWAAYLWDGKYFWKAFKRQFDR